MKGQIKSLIGISITVIVVILLTYLLTDVVIKKKNNTNVDSFVQDGLSLDYSDMIISSKTFDQNENDYMVIFFSEKDAKESIKTTMKAYTNDLKLYKVNTDEAINRSVLSKNQNENATNYSELKINKTTLITISNKKITSYITDTNEILNKLK